jgi:putative endonuclease
LTRSTAIFWVDILENRAGRFYVGQTDNLERRLVEHNQSGETKGKYTLKNGPWKLIWQQQHPTRGLVQNSPF